MLIILEQRGLQVGYDCLLIPSVFDERVEELALWFELTGSVQFVCYNRFIDTLTPRTRLYSLLFVRDGETRLQTDSHLASGRTLRYLFSVS